MSPAFVILSSHSFLVMILEGTDAMRFILDGLEILACDILSVFFNIGFLDCLIAI